jgi:CBS domain-containing protein
MNGEDLIGLMTERDYARNVILKGRSSAEMRVRELIVAPPVTVSPQHTVEDCMRLMSQHRIRHLPVLRERRVAGIVSIGDLVNWTISAQSETIHQLQDYIAGAYR